MGNGSLIWQIDLAAMMTKLQATLWSILPALGKLLIILVVAKVLMRAGSSLLQRLFLPQSRRAIIDPQKAKTLETLLQSSLRYFIYFVAGLTVLSTLGVKTESLLASAGIIGIALGLGAQNLVRDVLTGFFIIFEDQFGVGDYIETAGYSGTVVEMGLRVTKIRAYTGAMHVVPNSEINKISNHSRAERIALVDIPVAYRVNVADVQAILESTLDDIKKQVDTIVEGPRVMGMVSISNTDMVWRIWAKTEPMAHWSAEREIRKIVKIALDRAGFEPPYPRTVLQHERSER